MSQSLSPWSRMVGAFRTLGLKGWHRQLLRMNDTKVGRLVGTDYLGNKYYENNDEHIGRNRWVDYAQWDFNASQIPPEWHGWMNHIRALPPTEDKLIQQSQQAWGTNHIENSTGGRANFKTYSTVAPKMHAWEPQVARRE